MSQLERNDLRLGFVALNDCAPLVVAKTQGFFEAEGLKVELSREASWADIRDKTAAGAIDGAHMPAPMALAASMGVGGERTPMIVPLSLNLNGSGVTVSAVLAAALRQIDPEGMAQHPRTARPLARMIAARRASGQPPLTFAVVYPYAMQAYLLRYWLAAAGIDPDLDIRLIVAPPPRMAEQLKAGQIDGFCVGSPWNAVAAGEGDGEIVVYAADLWPVGPDKALGVTRAWADANPEALQAMLRALIKAAAWCDATDNRPALAKLLARSEYVDAPEDAVAHVLMGRPPYVVGEIGPASQDYIVYHRYAAGFPWRSHALWFLTQMLRWGQIGPEVDIHAVAHDVYRPDLYRQAAAALDEPAPLYDDKTEGQHPKPWLLMDATRPIPMAPDTFVDRRVFDPGNPLGYVGDFRIGRWRG